LETYNSLFASSKDDNPSFIMVYAAINIAIGLDNLSFWPAKAKM
jgi:hypothetical protein